MKNHRPARGTRGFIMRGFSNDAVEGIFFRVYDKYDKSKFTDYNLDHFDLEVEIVDSDSYFYSKTVGAGSKSEEVHSLDYGPQTLGIK